MPSRLAWILVALSWLFQAAPVIAASGDDGTHGGVSAPLLDAGVGARSAALGGAYIAVAEGADAGYWNPAALAMSSSGQALVGRGSLFAGITMDAVSVANHGWAATVLRLSSGPIPKTDADGNIIGTFEDAQTAIFLAYGRTLSPRLQGGASLKWYSEELDGERGSGLGFDLGLLYHVTANARLAAVLHQPTAMNIMWSTGHLDVRPASLDIGVGWQLREQVQVTAELTVPSAAWRAGVEWSVAPGLVVRAGRAPNGYTAGLGVGTSTLGLDYAFVSHADLQSTHRLSVSFGF